MKVIQSCVHTQMHRPPKRNAQLDEKSASTHEAEVRMAHLEDM